MPSRDLSQLVFSDLLERRPATMDELVDNYIAYQDWAWADDGYYLDRRTATGDHWWAVEAAGELVIKYPEIAWEFVLAVLARHPSSRAEESVIVGQLRDLMFHRGEAVVERIVERIDSDPEFWVAAAAVFDGVRHPEVRQKLLAAIRRREPSWRMYDAAAELHPKFPHHQKPYRSTGQH